MNKENFNNWISSLSSRARPKITSLPYPSVQQRQLSPHPPYSLLSCPILSCSPEFLPNRVRPSPWICRKWIHSPMSSSVSHRLRRLRGFFWDFLWTELNTNDKIIKSRKNKIKMINRKVRREGRGEKRPGSRQSGTRRRLTSQKSISV